MRVHEKLEQVHQGHCEVIAWRSSYTEPEVCGVLLVELGFEHDRHHDRGLHVVWTRWELSLPSRLQLQLTSPLNLVAVCEHLQVERLLAEVRDLLNHCLSWHTGWSRIPHNRVQLLELVRPIKGDIVPVLLECLLVHLIYEHDGLVGVDREFQLDS